ncbi:MAG: immune inhibitor A [Candidatus Eisenbacteria bacterium]|nr:immune inhibitor A [Candidatus Eisenbacteria bacterium]
MSRSGLILAICLCLLSSAPGRCAGGVTRSWQVSLEAPGSHERLMLGGFDVAHVRPGYRALVLADDAEAARLAATGFDPLLLDADPGRTLSARAATDLQAGGSARGMPASPETVPAFGAGTMAGHFTTTEIKGFLDSLAATDTHGIFSSVDTVGWSYRHRPIWGVRVTGPGAGPKPRVWYNALIHAREPGGMESLLHFLGRLHEGYGVDPDLTYLVDRRELYFVPLLNPDGYAVNESIYASTGSVGLWRKNTRDNDSNGILNGQDGVDLNRNFGAKWGYDNAGSSPTRASEAYRGPAAWSEPETRAVRAWCDSLQFTSALSFHAYGGLVLFPYGYVNLVPPDSSSFYEWGQDFAADNHSTVGNPPRTLYVVNGDADDWLYSEVTEKSRAWPATAEVGDANDGFWPQPSRVLPLARQQVRGEMGTAYLAGRFFRLQGAPVIAGDGRVHPGVRATMRLQVKNRGLTETGTGPLTATLRNLDGLAAVLDSVATYVPPPPGTIAAPVDSGFVVYAGPAVPPGRVLNFQVVFSDVEGYSGTDSFQVVVGTPAVLFADSAEAGMASWTANGWNTTTAQAHDGLRSFADSPGIYYLANADTRMTLAQPLDLSAAPNAYLFFWTRWDIEAGFDCGTVEISPDSGATWSALPGRFTRAGAGNLGGFSGGAQPLDAPVYDAYRHEFVEERVDLSAYAGPGGRPVLLRFRLRSDGGTQRDGWYVDGIRVVAFHDGSPTAVREPVSPPAFRAGRAGPNPTRGGARLEFVLPIAGQVHAEVLGVDGRRIARLPGGPMPAGTHWLEWDGRSAGGAPAPPGIYFLRLRFGQEVAVRKVAVAR